jgi:hypothetical protein
MGGGQPSVVASDEPSSEPRIHGGWRTAPLALADPLEVARSPKMFRKTLCSTLGAATVLFAVSASTSAANTVRTANENQPVSAQLG